MQYFGLAFVTVWAVIFIYAMINGWGEYRSPEKPSARV
jgi:hypothetical protein